MHEDDGVLSTGSAPQAVRPDPQGPNGSISMTAYRALVIVLLVALLVVALATLGRAEDARHEAACAAWAAEQTPGWTFCPSSQ